MTTPRTLIPPPAPGIYPSMPYETYHAIAAASSSKLKQLRRSPLHLRSYLDKPSKDTRALKIGRAAHAAVLEPDTFDAVFAVSEQCRGMTDKGTQCKNGASLYFANFGWRCGIHAKGLPESADDSRIIISADDYATSLRVRDAVHAHPRAAQLLAETDDTEVSLIWIDAETGVSCKARMDMDVHSLRVIADLKSTVDASERAFEKTIFNNGLDLQGTFYLDGAAAVGLDVSHYLLIAAEKEAPAVAVYRLRDEVISAGRERVRGLLRQYAECMSTGEFPGYSNDIVDIGIPTWAFSMIDEELSEAA